jgi:predicted glycoside hydrolase/deacetylase ChbG (UPF0249 family)
MRPLVLVFIILANAAFADAVPPRLIVRGDDMGAAHAINEAIMKCHIEGIQSSIEVIVPSPWFPEAVKMLADEPRADVGIHLALSSEWDNVKWRPLSDCPSLRDADGYFFPMIYPNQDYPRRSLKENGWQLADVEKEFRAQIELGLKRIPHVSHLSSHMNCTGIGDSVQALVKKLAIEYRLDVEPGELGVNGVGYMGPRGTSEEKIASFIKMLESLEPDKTYLFVDHPGFDTPEMRAIHHVGYEDVALDRQGVTDAWTSPRVREVVKAKGIQLIGYRDLRK